MALTEYEQQRQENIRKNQEVLASLHLPKLASESKQIHKTPKTKSVVSSSTHKKSKLMPMRKSSRLVEKATGIKEEPSAITKPLFYEPSKPKPPRIISKIPFEPTIGATSEFIQRMTHCKKIVPLSEDISPISISESLSFRHRHCIVKVATDRVYSMAFFPVQDKVIPIVGTKFGHLVFWDATDICEPSYEPPEDEQLDKEFHPPVYSFQPHREESISNIKIVDGDIFTTSYDGTMKRMDLNKGIFDASFVSDESDQWIICGADYVHEGNKHEWFITDVIGRLGRLDLRTKEKLVHTYQLHDNKKMGCLSVFHKKDHLMATACNDGSVEVWDQRMTLKEGKSTQKWQYTRAITSVYFHPTDMALVSTSYDDHIRIFDLHKQESDVISIHHNNQTGRWITPFKAIWDPKCTSLKDSVIISGNMNRGLDLYNGDTGYLIQNITSPWVTAQPAVVSAHPSKPIVGAGNASGKIILYL